MQDQRDLREIADTLFLRRTIRSGQAIHHTSNIIVVGDVNPGAEIVAGGDIIVWGVLRGMVHAGYPDNESACVCALHLTPVQLRIAHLLSRPPEGTDVQPRPEVAAIRNGRIVVETWVNGFTPTICSGSRDMRTAHLVGDLVGCTRSRQAVRVASWRGRVRS